LLFHRQFPVFFEDYARIFALDFLGNIIVYFNSFEECRPDLRLSFQILRFYFGNTLIEHTDPGRDPIDRDLPDAPECIGIAARYGIFTQVSSPWYKLPGFSFLRFQILLNSMLTDKIFIPTHFIFV
jgi:hypothetical protein